MTSRRVRALAIAGAWLLLAGASVTAASGPPGASSTGGDHWIVTLRPGTEPASEARRLGRSQGVTIEHVYQHVLSGFSFVGSREDADEIARSDLVASVSQARQFRITEETLPLGIQRIDAEHPTAMDAHEAGFNGVGVRIGILDTGIDLDHPDLNVDPALGINCMGAGPPEDGHGHGTHVAGISAARAGNGLGVIGVAPAATVVPVKVLDDTGVGTDATVICGVDYLTGLAADGDPANDVLVANMSLGEESSNIGHCTDGGLHEAICESIAAGVTYVVAAGNSTIDTSGFVPAAYPEVITVSALMDLDGEPGGLGGCFLFLCDDGLAFFSNYGSVVDVTAPGYNIYSTWKDGGYSTNSGTSMAAPHAAGVVALVVGANPALTPAEVRDVMATWGECADGTYADEADGLNCEGHGQWPGDPDGVAEPLVNAFRAASAANGWDPRPEVTITSPVDGAAVSGTVEIAAEATDDVGVVQVAFSVNGREIYLDADPSDGWSASWATTSLAPGHYTLSAAATDTGGGTGRSTGVTIVVGAPLQGDWVGSHGSDGWVLAGWNDTSDLAYLPDASLVIERGARWRWSASTAELRALEAPDESERRAAAFYDSTQLRLRLDFATAYAGNLHLYIVDWDDQGRRQRVTVNDGRGPQVVDLTGGYTQGAWLHFAVDVPVGGAVTIIADKTGGLTAVLSGIFLGDAP